MIKITYDLSHASHAEFEQFIALPGVARALDAQAQAGKAVSVRILGMPHKEEKLSHAKVSPR